MRVLDLGTYLDISAHIVNRVAKIEQDDQGQALEELHAVLRRSSGKDLIGVVLVLASCVASSATSMEMFRRMVVVKD